MQKLIQITDTIHETIYLSDLERQLMSTPYFNRLHDVYQSSTVYLTYPCNRTKRYEHCMGVMQLATKLFYNSFTNALSEEKAPTGKTIQIFFEQLKKEADKIVSAIYRSNNGGDEYDPLKFPSVVTSAMDSFAKECRRSIPETKTKYFRPIVKLEDVTLNKYTVAGIDVAQERFLYQVLIEAIRIAALFHDIGHPPYSHIVEGALKEIYNVLSSKSENELTTREREFVSILSSFIESGSFFEKSFKNDLAIKTEGEVSTSLALHEAVGLKMTKSALMSVFQEKFSSMRLSKGVENITTTLYYTLLYEFIFAILLEKNDFWRCIHSIIAATFDSDRMDYIIRDTANSGVNWGRVPYERVLSSAKMILVNPSEQKLAIAFAEKNIDVLDDILTLRYKIFTQINYHHKCVKMATLLQECVKILAFNYLSQPELDSETEYMDISYLWRSLINVRNADNAVFKVMQWNDSWLMNLLYREFVNYKEQDTDDYFFLINNFEELLLGKKHYKSIIKRPADIREIFRRVAEELTKKIEFEHLIKTAKNIKTKRTLKLLYNCLNPDNIYELDAYYDFHIDSLIQQSFEEALRDLAGENRYIVKPISFNIAGDGCCLYNTDNLISNYSDMSNIFTILNKKHLSFPRVFAYVDTAIITKSITVSTIKDRVVQNLSNKIYEIFTSIIEI